MSAAWKRGLRLAAVVATVLSVAALLATGLGRDPAAIASPLVGRAAPAFRLGGLDGPAVRLSDLRGQVVVVNFWASWCTECRTEQDALNTTWSRYRDSGVTVLGVNFQDTTSDARDYMGSHGISYPVIEDKDSSTSHRTGPDGIRPASASDGSGAGCGGAAAAALAPRARAGRGCADGRRPDTVGPTRRKPSPDATSGRGRPMTATLVAAGLASLCVLVILRPFASTAHLALAPPESDPESDRDGELLRQLRDLDEDLASGKLDEDDHRRLRDPVERQAAQALRRVGSKRTATTPPVKVPMGGHGRRSTWVALAAGAIAVTGVWVLLSGSLTPRSTGETISGGAPPASSPLIVNPKAASGSSTTATPNPAQLAEVEAAAARVRSNPKDVVAHLDLARTYAGAGNPQLSAIEYLAVTQLDPTNAGANTQLALVAFAAGQPAQAKNMVDTALRAHPSYPEALYARGLIQLMGLRQPAAAERDLKAYLAAAPRGSHRASVETLLAMARGPAR